MLLEIKSPGSISDRRLERLPAAERDGEADVTSLMVAQKPTGEITQTCSEFLIATRSRFLFSAGHRRSPSKKNGSNAFFLPLRRLICSENVQLAGPLQDVYLFGNLGMESARQFVMGFFGAGEAREDFLKHRWETSSGVSDLYYSIFVKNKSLTTAKAFHDR